MKKIFLLVSVLLLIVAIPATTILVNQQQELRKKAAPATTLVFSPATVSKKVGESLSLDITIDTGENQVVVAELHVVFDPAKLEAQTITNSTLFPNILTSGKIERGAASITVGAASGTKPIKGTGTVAVVRIKALEKTDVPATIRLASNTFVGGLGESATNVLVGTTPATITITGDGASKQLLATPSAQLSPSPTPTASPSGTASPSATFTISAPASGSAATTGTPTIRGKAAPGATITITIYSTPQTVTVKADNNGNWSYTPTTQLADGSHNVVASTTDASGNTKTATTSFVVAGASTGSASQSATIAPTAQPIPQSGTISPTLAVLAVGIFLLLTGVISFALVTP